MSDDKEEYKPGRVATLEEMLEAAKKLAEEDIYDGLNTKHLARCPHTCRCICHIYSDQLAQHTSVCCSQCNRCDKNIKLGHKKQHLEECHANLNK